MRNSLSILILALVLFARCSQDCTETTTYFATTPVYGLVDSIRNAVEVQEPRKIEKPEKLYFKDDYIFLVESGLGIHVINNSDPRNPITERFIQIPGNHDVAIQDQFLYADSYTDLLVFDVSNVNGIKLENRIPSVFEYYGDFYFASNIDLGYIVIDIKEEFITEEIAFDCSQNNNNRWNLWSRNEPMPEFALADGGVSSGGSGTGGSMARFTITNGQLYTVDHYSIRHFDIANPATPIPQEPVQIGWDIETVFPYGQNLFIGSRSGMHIYDISNPDQPTFAGLFQHATACDPVVVQGDIAYVTLRDGQDCQTFTNQLDIVDVSDVTNPRLMKSYPMQNPHGLGIQNDCLYICEGDFGLKHFDASDPLNIVLKNHFPEIHALDVIPLQERLLLIGNDGLQQYEGICKEEILYLSTLGL
ncbi:MAG: hypothetical protein RIC03_03030 [Cyclobacteriaceae bacterium]